MTATTGSAELLALADKVGKDLACTRTYSMREWAIIETALRLAAKPAEDVREATIKECAKIAQAHKGSAAKRRHQLKIKTLPQDQEALNEILTEERGEDIAAEIIEREIRALSTPGQPNP